MSLTDDVASTASTIADVAHAIERAVTRPSVLYRPTLFAVGDEWVVLLGPDRHIGLSVSGKTPAQAMTRFDVAFQSARPPQAIP